jgi:signal recognition particle subunit SRP54
MFQLITNKFSNIFSGLRNKNHLTEHDIKNAMEEVKDALLEADVAISVVKELIDNISKKALGEAVYKSTTPSQIVIKIVNDALIEILGSSSKDSQLNLIGRRPANIMMVGLQGSGKTTFSAKIANLLKKNGKKILLVSLDIYRPAAQEQLKILADSINVDSLEIVANQKPYEIVKRAIKESHNYDVVIYDTAGRLHINEELIEELNIVKDLLTPSEILLTVDALIGQDASNIAFEFNRKVGVTGNLLSKVDGDAKGGAALSIRYITQKPIKFLGVGEKVEDIEEFDPEKMVGRILDKGDIVSLVKKAQEVMSDQEAEKASKRMMSGKFNLNDYLTQIQGLKKMGGLSKILKLIPGASQLENRLQNSHFNDSSTLKQEAIILSMTKKERIMPEIINMSRKQRIIKGSGVTMSEMNKLIKQYEKISSMMKKMGKMDPQAIMNQINNKFGS